MIKIIEHRMVICSKNVNEDSFIKEQTTSQKYF